MIPQVACIASKLPIIIHIEHVRAKSSLGGILVVHLRSFKIQIESHINTRVATTSRSGTPIFLTEGSVEETLSIQCHHLFMQLRGQTSLAEHIPDIQLAVSRLTIPSFKTFNVSVRHTLSVELVGRCADKDFAVDMGSREIFNLPEVYTPPAMDDLESIPPYRAVGTPYDPDRSRSGRVGGVELMRVQ